MNLLLLLALAFLSPASEGIKLRGRVASTKSALNVTSANTLQACNCPNCPCNSAGSSAASSEENPGPSMASQRINALAMNAIRDVNEDQLINSDGKDGGDGPEISWESVQQSLKTFESNTGIVLEILVKIKELKIIFCSQISVDHNNSLIFQSKIQDDISQHWIDAGRKEGSDEGKKEGEKDKKK
eukprot:jgi/Bigna1/128547/aug1.7_g3255